MSAFPSEKPAQRFDRNRSEIVRQVKAQDVCYLRTGSFNSRRLADIVNNIRLNPEFFSEWHLSVIAMRFAEQRTREAVCTASVQH